MIFAVADLSPVTVITYTTTTNTMPLSIKYANAKQIRMKIQLALIKHI